MGGTPSPDNLGDIAVSGDQANFEYDLDNDQIQNENDSFPLDSANGTDAAILSNKPHRNNPNKQKSDHLSMVFHHKGNSLSSIN